jgi:ribonuclease J
MVLFSDSTYVERPGYTPSERVVGEALDHIIAEAPGRVIIATFASLISRIQQVIDAAAKHNRRVIVIGRSMVDNVEMATKLGYLNIPEGVLARVSEMNKLPPREVVVAVTGTQGEPTSTLVRLANRDHPQIRVVPEDTIVLSATPIPGNEALVNRTIDNLLKQKARVLYEGVADVHVHGHGSQEELKMMISLVRPKFFVPIHGEYRHLAHHVKLAQSMGIPAENTFLLNDGDILELDRNKGRVVGRVPSGHVYVDGLGVGDVGRVVLRDRRLLSQDGVVIVIISMDRQSGRLVGRPEVVSRGFVDMADSEALMEKSRDLVMRTLDRGGEHIAESGYIQAKVKDSLARFLYEQTKRRPMILPIAVEV